MKRGYPVSKGILMQMRLFIHVFRILFTIIHSNTYLEKGLIFSLIRTICLILLGFGILQVGLSLKGHDPSQRANGMLTVAGGIVITFTKEILTLITG